MNPDDASATPDEPQPPDDDASRSRLIRRFITAAVLIGLVVYGVLDRRAQSKHEPSPAVASGAPEDTRDPKNQALSDFARRAVENDRMRVATCTVAKRVDGSDTVEAVVHVTGIRAAIKAYGEIYAAYKHPSLTFDPGRWSRVREWVSRPTGAALIRAAALDAEAEGLAKATIIMPLNSRDYNVAFDVVVRGRRSDRRWQYTLEETGEYKSLVKPSWALSLSDFPGEVLVVDRASDQDRLAAVGRRLPDIEAGLRRAMPAVANEQRATLAELLRPGTMFSGSVGPSGPEAPRVFFEVAELDATATPMTIAMVVRHDGGGDEQRRFAGPVEFSVERAASEIVLTAPPVRRSGFPGPFMDDDAAGINLLHANSGDVMVRLLVDGTALVATDERLSLRLERMTEDARTAWRSQMAANADALLAATTAGTQYEGTITNGATGKSEPYWLRFTAADEKRHHIAVELEHARRAEWRCDFDGEVLLNRYQAVEGRQVVLFPRFVGEEVPPMEMRQTFRPADGDPVLRLAFTGGRLTGKAGPFAYNFAPVGADIAARRAAIVDDRRARTAAFVAPGAIHEGTVERNGRAGAVCLRILGAAGGSATTPGGAPAVSPAEQRYEALLYAPDEPRFATPVTVRLQASDGQVDLEFGNEPFWPARGLQEAPMLKPQFVGGSLYRETVTLLADEKGYAGAMSYGDAMLQFRFSTPTAEKLASLQREKEAREKLIIEFLQPGALYEVSVRHANALWAQRVRLRLTGYKPQTGAVEAMLEHPAEPRFRAVVNGRCDVVQGTISFEVQPAPGGWPAEALEAEPSLRPHVHDLDQFAVFIKDGRLVGVSNSLPGEAIKMDFAPVAEAARRVDTERDQRWNEFFTDGSVHEAAVQDVLGKKRALLSLRILRYEPRSGALTAILTSKERPNFASALEGQVDTRANVARLHLVGTAASAQGSALSDPAVKELFTIEPVPHEYAIGLFPSDEGVAGIYGDEVSTFLTFRFTAARPPSSATSP